MKGPNLTISAALLPPLLFFLVFQTGSLFLNQLIYAEESGSSKKQGQNAPRESLELEEIKKKLKEKELTIRGITKYLKGNISFIDNYSSDILLNFAEALYDYADLTHTYEVIQFDQREETGKGPPKPDFTTPIAFLNEVISKRGFDEAIDKFFYLRAICYEEQGMIEKSAENFKRIVERYQFSSLFPESVFRLGEYYFSTGQTGMAIDTYSLNRDKRSSRFYDKTLYKLGWSYYRARDYVKAIDYFLEVAQAAFLPEPAAGRRPAASKREARKKMSSVNLADEALTYVALSFVNFGKPSEIETFFTLKGKPYSEKLLEKIGDAFSEQAKFDEAVAVYKKLLSMFPLSLEMPWVYGKIVSILEKTVSRDTDIFAAKKEFITFYSPGSPWFEHNIDILDTSKLLDTLEPMIVKTAGYYLKQAGGGNDNAFYGVAADLYSRYIDIFKKSRRANRVSFLLGEALFGLRKYNEAVTEYKKSAWEYPGSRFQEKSAYAVILTYEEILNLAGRDSVKGKKTAKKMIVEIERFLRKFPDVSSSESIRVKEGEIYFNLGNYDQVVALFKSASTMFKSMELKIAAATFLADSYFNKKNYRLAEIEYRELSSLAAAASNYSVQRRADRQRVVSVLNLGQSLKKRGDLENAAEMFERAGTLSHSTEESRFALGEAIKIYIETRKWSKFNNAVIHYQNQYSEMEKVARFLVAAGKISEENFQFLQAANYFERAAGLIAKTNKVRDYLLVAANNYQKSGDIEKAVTIFTKLSRRPYLEGKKRIEYLFRAGELLDRKGASGDAAKVYREVIAKHKELTGRGEPGNAYYFGKSRFIILGPELDMYMGQKLKQPFNESFKRKANFMQKLIRDYIEISRLNVHEFTSRSLFTIGQVFENFRDEILHSDIPENLLEEEREEYTFMLEEKAFPYEQNAEKTYKKNINLARKKSVTNTYVDLSYKRLALLSPALYKREETAFPLRVFIPEPVFMEELEEVEVSTESGEAR